MKLNVDLGNIPVDASDTDEDLRQKAKSHLPIAQQKLAKAAAEQTWKAIEKEGKGFIDTSYSAKSKFIRETERDFKLSASEKSDLETDIFEQLKADRDGQ